MLKVGLTGGIGTGKTTVAKVFKILGVPVFDADTSAKKLMNENSDLKQEIRREFGDRSYIDDALDRKYIAEMVFNNTYKLERLNALVHPVVIQEAKNWARKQRATYLLKEAALMFEAGSTSDLDFIIGVFAPLDLRINRVMNRDRIAKEQVMARIQNQIDEKIKLKLCDFVIQNDENTPLISQIIDIHKKICVLAQ